MLHYGGPPTAMNTVLAIIANGGQAFVDINIEASRNKLISHLLYIFILNPSTVASSNPLRRGSQGSKPLDGKTAHHGGDVCERCVSLAKSRSFPFLPLCVKLLRGYQRQTESSYENMHHHVNLKNLGCRIMEVK